MREREGRGVEITCLRAYYTLLMKEQVPFVKDTPRIVCVCVCMYICARRAAKPYLDIKCTVRALYVNRGRSGVVTQPKIRKQLTNTKRETPKLSLLCYVYYREKLEAKLSGQRTLLRAGAIAITNFGYVVSKFISLFLFPPFLCLSLTVAVANLLRHDRCESISEPLAKGQRIQSKAVFIIAYTFAKLMLLL